MKSRGTMLMSSCLIGGALALACGCGGGGSGGDAGADTQGETMDSAGDVATDDALPDDGAADEGDGATDPGEDAAGDAADAAGDAEADAPGDECPRPGDPGPGSRTIDVEHGGLARSYILHVPPSYDPTVRTPVVLNMHGYSSSASQEVIFTDMNTTADARGFVVVYPEGYESSWNAGTCCGEAAADGIDDVSFLVAVVDDVASRLCVDRDRVYASGMSNGGFMSYRLACEAAGVFAGAAPVAGSLGIPSCTPSEPVPLIAYHGTEDSYVDYAYGQASFEAYATASGCSGTPVHTVYGESYCDVYDSCTGGIRVGLCTLAGMDHCWPGGPAPRPLCEAFIGAYSEDINANEHMWDFFSL